MEDSVTTRHAYSSYGFCRYGRCIAEVYHVSSLDSGVVLLIVGLVKALKGEVLLGVILIILGFLVGPGGASFW